METQPSNGAESLQVNYFISCFRNVPTDHQMQRAAYSIPSNLSEGCGRGSDKDFHRFIQIALGSAHELGYFFILSRDPDLIEEKEFLKPDHDINLIKKKRYALSIKL